MQTNTTTAQPKELLDRIRDKIRFKHNCMCAENNYLSWIKQFILQHGKRHLVNMGAQPGEVLVAYLYGLE